MWMDGCMDGSWAVVPPSSLIVRLVLLVTKPVWFFHAAPFSPSPLLVDQQQFIDPSIFLWMLLGRVRAGKDRERGERAADTRWAKCASSGFMQRQSDRPVVNDSCCACRLFGCKYVFCDGWTQRMCVSHR
mmetsp:Transcript_29851/g.86600  ORF Transcript_29851/g.86600 Transcript_29851/m.86600 type:complete len:130 (+) Transcript_29851:273-662(+)